MVQSMNSLNIGELIATVDTKKQKKGKEKSIMVFLFFGLLEEKRHNSNVNKKIERGCEIFG